MRPTDTTRAILASELPNPEARGLICQAFPVAPSGLQLTCSDSVTNELMRRLSDRRSCIPLNHNALTKFLDSILSSAAITLPISDAMLSCIAGAVSTSHDLHNRTNGSTVSLAYGSMAGKNFFAVSIYPARKIEFWERPSWQELFEFAKANLDLLLKPNCALSTWFNDRECLHIADVVACTPDRDAAVGLGLRADQEAVFDLEARREIPIPLPRQGFNANQHTGGAQ